MKFISTVSTEIVELRVRATFEHRRLEEVRCSSQWLPIYVRGEENRHREYVKSSHRYLYGDKKDFEVHSQSVPMLFNNDRERGRRKLREAPRQVAHIAVFEELENYMTDLWFYNF